MGCHDGAQPPEFEFAMNRLVHGRPGLPDLRADRLSAMSGLSWPTSSRLGHAASTRMGGLRAISRDVSC